MDAVVTTYRRLAVFRSDRFNPVVLGETERVRALVVCFEAGQFIPMHKTAADMALAVLEGEGVLVVGDRAERIWPGTVAFVPTEEARGIKANTRMVTLQVVAPPPTEADHSDVSRKLQRGSFQ